MINATRWNIEEDGDDLLICKGGHHRSDACVPVRYRAASEVEAEIADLKRQVMELQEMRKNWLDDETKGKVLIDQQREIADLKRQVEECAAANKNLLDQATSATRQCLESQKNAERYLAGLEEICKQMDFPELPPAFSATMKRMIDDAIAATAETSGDVWCGRYVTHILKISGLTPVDAWKFCGANEHNRDYASDPEAVAESDLRAAIASTEPKSEPGGEER